MRLYVGDVEAGDMLRARDLGIAAILTDPPWNAGIARQMRQWAGADCGPVPLPRLYAAFARDAAALLPLGPVVVEIGAQGERALRAAMAGAGFAPWLDILCPAVSYQPYRTIAFGAAPSSAVPRDWTDCDPAGIRDQILAELAIPRGSVVFDPFIGLGTVIPPLLRAGLVPAGMEINPRRLAAAAAIFLQQQGQ